MSLGLALGSLLLSTTGSLGPELSYRVWTAEDGLPQNSVYGIAQTPDGYLWIATLDGLVRFDGARMKVFNRSEYPEMSSNRLLALFVDREGTLWIGTQDGGLMRLRDGGFRSFGPTDGVPGKAVSGFLEDTRGRLWAMSGGTFIRFDDGRWVQPPEAALLPGEYLPGYTFAAMRPEGMRILERDGRLVEYPWTPEVRARWRSMYRDPYGAFWLRLSENRFLTFQDGRTGELSGPEADGTEFYPPRYAAMTDGPGRLWLLRKSRLSVLENGTWRTFAASPSSALPRPLVMFRDREGSLWIGGDPGLVQATPTPLRNIVPEGSVYDRNIYPIAEAADGRVWIGSQAIPAIYDSGRLTPLPEYLPEIGAVRAIEPEADGGVLLGTERGWLERVRPDGRRESLYRGESPINQIHRDASGALWVASGRGLMRLASGRETWWRTEEGLPGEEVVALEPSADGSLWIGCFGGLARLADGKLTTWTMADGLSSDKIRALHEESDGTLWIGTYDGGLTRLARGRMVAIRKKDGLYDDGAFAILDDGLGRFWIPCNRGIYSVDRIELDAFASGQLPSVSHRALGRGDGMVSAECNGGRQPAGFRKSDGTLWFPTQHGVVVVDPRDVRLNRVRPQVVFEEAASEHRPIPLGGPLRLRTDERRLEVRFSAPTFVRPEQARFRYFLDGLDDAWSEAGPDRTVRYAYVPPGRYTLRVTAANSDGLWNEEGGVLEVEVEPAVWETAWFRGGVALTVLGGIVVGFRRRIRGLKLRRAEQDAFARRLIESQEAERKRIAGELHDGIGQTLVVIRNRALLGLRDGEDAGKSRVQMAEISEAASVGIEEVRKVAYNLRPYQLDRLGLRRAIEAAVEQVAESSGIPIAADVGPVDGVFAAADEINVYRIVQEGLNNVVRHAQATRGRVSVTVHAEEVRIEIEDDGRGFDPANCRSGLGLSGIAERARILRGQHLVRSIPGRGTTVLVTLPKGAGAA